MKNFPPVVKNLLIINCLVFFAEWVFTQTAVKFPLEGWMALYYAGSPLFR